MAAPTQTERYLSKLCQQSFLRFWSWPNVYRDQPAIGSSVGKEVCDLLVVFGNNVFIFSDKSCEFPNTGDGRTDWARWFRRAILKSAKQVWGAEKWIRQHPDRLFTDPACSEPLPVPLPPADQTVFHRVVVAHGSGPRCRKELGGSGSLMVAPHIVGSDHFDLQAYNFLPFAVGRLDPSKGYVHVIDDFTLDILLETIDTAPDLAKYLERKEEFILSGRLGMAAGEEEMLAWYLRNVDDKDQHCFEFPESFTEVVISEGLWADFRNHPDRVAQIEADRVSYAWDDLIEKFTEHILGGTEYHKGLATLEAKEKALRLMASEPRTHRRALSRSLLAVVDRADHEERSARIILPASTGGPCYVFLALKPRDDRSPEEYRTLRLGLLGAYCMVTRLRFPDARDIVGIATESLKGMPSRSEDLAYLDGASGLTTMPWRRLGCNGSWGYLWTSSNSKPRNPNTRGFAIRTWGRDATATRPVRAAAARNLRSATAFPDGKKPQAW